MMSGDLHEAMWAWLQAAISILSTRSIPQRIDWQLSVDDRGGFSGQGVTVPDVHALVHDAGPILRDLPETACALEATLKDVDVTQALIRGVQGDDLVLQRIALFTNCLAPFLIEVMRRESDTTNLKVRFDAVLGQLEDFVYRYNQLGYRWVIHLAGIRSELQSIELNENVRLRRASLDDQKSAFAASEVHGPLTWPSSSGVKRLPPPVGSWSMPLVVIEITQQHCLPYDRPSSEPARTIGRRVLEALGLAGEEDVAGHTIWREDSCIFANVDDAPEWFDNNRLKFLPYPHYVVTSEKAAIVQQVFPLIELPPEPDRLSLARQRLLYSYDRQYVADPILDCWIGLETLFLPDGDGELKLRAALRIAQYLGETSAERHQIFGLAKNSYNARSALAHGNLKSIQKLDETLVSETRSLLRRAIRKSLLEGRAPVVQQLDESLLD